MANLTITQVASKYGLTPDTLRYYEKIDLLPPIPRTPGGRRYYPQGVQDWIEMIVCLRHSGGAGRRFANLRQATRAGRCDVNQTPGAAG